MEGLDLANVSIFVTAAVIGATELIRRIAARDWQGSAIIVVSALIGAIAGALSIDGLTVANGIVAGLVASGLVTFASKFGNNTSPNVEVK